MKFKLSHAVSGEIPVLGHRHPFDWTANRTTTHSEQDVAVVRYLVSIGWAEIIDEEDDALPEPEATKVDEPVIEAEEEPPPEPTEEEA